MKRYLIIILILGAVLRLLFLSDFPAGVSGDEVGQGYTAYSILKTGSDEWGQPLPLFPRSFGDYKGPILSYLMVPTIAVFGLNELGIRLPIAIAGVVTIFFTYLLTKSWFKNETIAIWAAFILAINPWHIQLSRTAFEGTVGVLFFVMGFWAYLESREEKKFLILSAVFWGVSLYTYQSYKLFVPIFVFAVLLFDKNIKLTKTHVISALVIFFMAVPLALNLDSTESRFNDVSIFSQVESQEILDRKFFTPNKILRIITANPVVFIGEKFVNNYLSFFSLDFYFTGSRSDSSYLNFPYTNLLYLIELPLVLFYLGFLGIREITNGKYAYIWLLLAPLPAAIATSEGSANRAVTLVPLMSVISAVGLYNLGILVYKKIKFKRFLANALIVAIFLMSLFIFLLQYIYYIPNKPIISIRYGYREVFLEVIKESSKYDYIVISHHFTNPQAYVAFFGQVDPSLVQEESNDWLRYQQEGKLYVDQLSDYRLGKFEFKDISWNDDRLKKGYLFIGAKGDFPEKVEPIYEYKDKFGKVIFQVVSSDENANLKI